MAGLPWRSTRHPETASGARYGLLAGVGFAVQFLAISRIDPTAGLWPILAARVTATLTIVPMARAAGATLRIPRRLISPALIVGPMGSVAIVLYLAATREQLLALATVLAALYPAIPVVLAIAFLRERPPSSPDGRPGVRRRRDRTHRPGLNWPRAN